MSQKNFRSLFTIYFIIFGIIITLFSSFISYKLSMIDIKERIDTSAQHTFHHKKTEVLKPAMDRLDQIVLALKNNPALYDYLEQPDNAKKDVLNNLFFAVTNSNRLIMQARFIDAKGKERVRVDRLREDEYPFIVTEENLQNKAHRDYFKTVSNLKEAEIWHSALDLNIENKKIEVPFRPTIRAAVPIVINKTFKGMIIVNMLTHELIANLRSSNDFHHYIVDKEGNFILHPDETLSWGKYTNSTTKVNDFFPKNSEEKAALYIYDLNEVLHNSDGAQLILQPTELFTQALFETKIKTSFLVIFLSILISIPLALYLSKVPSRLQESLLESNTKLQNFADIIDRYIINVTTDVHTNIRSVSSAFVKSSGYSKEELINHKTNLIRHPDTSNKVYEEMWSALLSGKQWFGEIKNKKKNGEAYWVEETIIPIRNHNQEIDSFMAISVDISAKKLLETLSTTDVLTNLYNRRKLDESIHHEIETAKRYQTPLSLIMIDIDHFKDINDTYGHSCGDIVLSSVADTLRKNLRSSDIIGRYGGEEFIILSPLCSLNDAYNLAEKLRILIEQFPFEKNERLTISLGIALFDSDIDDPDSLIKKADQALYQAKEEGRNRTIIFKGTSKIS